MKAGDLVKLKRSSQLFSMTPESRRWQPARRKSTPGVVIKVKPLSTGDWALVVWPDEMSTWNNFRDLEVVSET